MAKALVYYVSPAPTVCDIEATHAIVDAFVDGATTMGPWANMCPACFTRYGRGLGTGRGQKYEKQFDGRWLKTEG